ncbi:MAG: AhpC/TSA family protein [Chitinophagaceae bacterium]|nr:AhpC/TSA family protein [Chitinophagaceae bacterium]
MRSVFAAFFTLLFLQSYSQYAFELNGRVPPSLNHQKLVFCIWDVYSNHAFKKTDTILIKNNAFSVKGFLNKPSENAYLLLMDKRSQVYFVIDSGKNTMIVHEIPANSITKKNKLSASEMINSKSNILKKKLDRFLYEDYLEEQRNKNNKSDSLAVARLKQLRLKEFNLLQQFPDTYYSLIKLYSLSGARSLKLDKILAFYNTLDARIRETTLGKELKEKLLNYYKLEAGSAVKSFSAFTPTGANFTNQSLNDTVYLLAFGATWCGPCKQNIPMLKGVYNKFRDKKFAIVYVNLDGNEDVWKSQIKSYGMDWINVSDNVKWKESELVKAFNITVIPLYFVIDQDQKIVYNSRSRLSENAGYEEMEQVITGLLK